MNINWINIKERLPDEDGDYLCIINNPYHGKDDCLALIRFTKDVSFIKYIEGASMQDIQNGYAWYSTGYGDGDYNFIADPPLKWSDNKIVNFTA